MSTIPYEKGIVNGYRADIDGLRAVAVLSVILYHLNHVWLPGGFVGVDIFFVVSGYVVSLSLAQLDGSRGLLAFLVTFYSRRLKRLLPAVAVCISTTVILVALLLVPFPQFTVTSFYRTAIASMVGLSNVYLIRAGTQYFNIGSAPNPFLHTWSLGVEEQFYVTFPALLFLAGCKATARAADCRRLGLVLLLCLLSLLLSWHWCLASPNVAYFAMPSRLWELGCGAALAYAQRLGYLEVLSRHHLVNTGLRWMGIGLLASAFATTVESGFPFPGALPSVLGTALVIATGLTGNSMFVQVLQSKLPVFVGKLSYSLYLWHWPTICVLYRLVGVHRPIIILAALPITAGFSLVSYYTVERPLRYRLTITPRLVFLFAAAVVALVVAGTEVVSSERFAIYLGTQSNWNEDWQQEPEVLRFETGSIAAAECDLTGRAKLDGRWAQHCLVRWDDSRRYPRLYLLGDSHALADLHMVRVGVDRRTYELFAFMFSGCDIQLSAAPHEASDLCQSYWSSMRDFIVGDVRSGDLVMLATYLRSYKSLDDDLASGILGFARSLRERGATLIIQSPLPVYDSHPYDCLPTWFKVTPEGCTKDRRVDDYQRRPAVAFLKRLVAQDGAIKIWNPYDILCPGMRCFPFRDGKPLYRDSNHLALYGAAYLGPHFLKFLRNSGLLTPRISPTVDDSRSQPRAPNGLKVQ